MVGELATGVSGIGVHLAAISSVCSPGPDGRQPDRQPR